MEKAHGKLFHRFFWSLIRVVVLAVVVVAAVGFITPYDEERIQGAFLGGVFGLLFIGTPLLIILSGLSIWGAVKYRRYGFRYVVLALALPAWLYYAIDGMITYAMVLNAGSMACGLTTRFITMQQ